MNKKDHDIRSEFLRAAGYEKSTCRLELAKFAIDKGYMGFEDPRSAALEVLKERGDTPFCERANCDASIKVNTINDTYIMTGECDITDVCGADIKNDVSEKRRLRENKLIRRASSEQLSYICPHVRCEFSFGFTVDGNSGTAGTCMNGVSAEIKPEQ